MPHIDKPRVLFTKCIPGEGGGAAGMRARGLVGVEGGGGGYLFNAPFMFPSIRVHIVYSDPAVLNANENNVATVRCATGV